MIIVEGPDGGGKSTLIKALHKDFRVPLSGHSRLSDTERNDPSYRSRENVRKRVYGAVLREVTARQSPELHDRLFYSPMIYDHVFGREPSFNYEEEITINRILNALKVPVIFCLPPWEAINQQYLSVGQMVGVPEHIKKVYDQYTQMAGFMGTIEFRGTLEWTGKGKRRPSRDYGTPPVIYYDFTKKRSYDKVKMQVAEYLTRRKKRSSTWTGTD